MKIILLSISLPSLLICFLFPQKSEGKNSEVIENLYNNIYIDSNVRGSNVFLNTEIDQDNSVYQLISHAKPGELYINDEWLNKEEIVSFLKTQFKSATNTIQHINIYGCEFAKGQEGIEAVKYIEKQLNVFVAASTNITGNGGDWILEVGNSKSTLAYTAYPYSLQCAGDVGGTAPEDDFDGDGVCNEQDIDDDNDGVLDVDEGQCANPTSQYIMDRKEGFWELENNLEETSGANHELQSSNGPSFSTKAVQGSFSGSFNGTSNFINYSGFGFMQGPISSMTISMWINPSDVSGTRVLYEEGDDFNGLTVYINDGQLVFFTVSNRASESITHQINIVEGRWQHVAATFAQGRLSLYIDGVVSNSSIMASFVAIDFMTDFGAIGAHNGVNPAGVTGYYAGLIDGISYSGSEAWSASYIATESLKLCDSDNNGSYNHLSLDSDGDGCSDGVEAGSILLANNNIATYPTGTDANSNGVLDVYEGGNYASAYATNALDDQINTCGAVVVAAGDADNDGVEDAVDIDDDNDGVLDVDEFLSTELSQGTFDNTTVWTISPAGSLSISGTSSIYFGQDNGASATISQPITNAIGEAPEITLQSFQWRNVGSLASQGFTVILRYAGVDYLQIDGTVSGSPQVTALNGASANKATLGYTSVHPTNYTTAEDVKVTLPSTFPSSGNVELFFQAGTSATVRDVLIGNLSFTIDAYRDTDNDLTYNHLDLDSDGDGCSDSLEAGSASLGETVATTDVNGNGLLDDYEDSGLTGGINYNSTYDIYALNSAFNEICTDTDGDNVNNITDIDDDNDGVLDLDETKCANPSSQYISEQKDAFWAFENTTDDTSGNNHNAVNANGPTYSADAIEGSFSAVFNGTSNYIQYSNGTFMNNALTKMSISMWIKPSELSGVRVLYEEGGVANGIALYINNGQLAFVVRGHANVATVTHQTNININLWQHVTATFNEAELNLYLDGIPSNTSSILGGGYLDIPFRGDVGAIGGVNGANPTNISGATYYAGLMDAVSYSNTDVWDINHIGTESIRLCDTDGDTVFNHLDLDSDGDGCSDSVEAGNLLVNANDVSTYRTGADSNNNGLLDEDEDGATGNINYTSTYATYALNDQFTVCTDTDGDNIGDLVDLDDDNDGILDVNEGQCTNPSSQYILNQKEGFWTFENTTDDVSGNGHNAVESDEPTYSTDAVQGNFSASFNGTSNYVQYSDGTFMNDAFTQMSFSMWIKPSNVTGSKVLYEIGGGIHGIELYIDNGQLVLYAVTNGIIGTVTHQTAITIGEWQHVAAVFDAGQLRLYVNGVMNSTPGSIAATEIPYHVDRSALGGFLENSPGGVVDFYEGLIDAFSYSATAAWSSSYIATESLKLCDTDTDGIYNHLDLDSDGDGCADVLESEGGFGLENLVASTLDGGSTNIQTNLGTDVDVNGVPTIANGGQAVGDSQVVGPDVDNDGVSDACDCYDNRGADMDGDGVPDASDVDADNDGISNINENSLGEDPYGDIDDDGVYNYLDDDSEDNTVGDVDGMIEAGYDTDGDGVPNHLDLDSDNDGIPDSVEAIGDITVTVCAHPDGDVVDVATSCETGATTLGLLIPIDTDRDGVPDFLDLDSDGDTCQDGIEAGATAETVNTADYTTVTSTEVTANGLVTTVGCSIPTDINWRDDAINDACCEIDEATLVATPTTAATCIPVDDDFITITGGNLYASTSYSVSYTQDGNQETATIATDASGVLVITGLTSGSYTNITITSATYPSICSGVIEGPIAVQPYVSNLAVSDVVTSSVSCKNPSAGLINITVSGGLAPYNYVWSTTDGILPADQVNAEDLSGLTMGTYTVLVTDANGCTIEESFTISEACLEFVKTALVNDGGNGHIEVGEIITYSFEVTNNGSVAIDNIVINDARIGVVDLALTPSSLAPGAVGNATAAYTITQSDIDAESISNTATARGEDPDGNLIEDISDSDDPTATGPDDPTITELVLYGNIALEKVGTFNDLNSNGYADIGETITYTFRVENTGNVTLTDVVISDALVAVNGGPISLVSHEVDATSFTATYMLTEADINNGLVTNVAIATGTEPNTEQISDVSDDPNIDTNVDTDGDGDPEDPTQTIIPPFGSLSIEATKYAATVDTNNDGIIGEGDVIEYTITIANTGQVELQDISLQDVLTNGDGTVLELTTGVTFKGATSGSSEGVLQIGEIATYSATYEITEEDAISELIENTINVTAVDANGRVTSDISDDGIDDDGNTEDDPTVVNLERESSISILKEVIFNDENNDGYATVGETISYLFTITNTGGVDLFNVSLEDNLSGIEIKGETIAVLKAGEIDTNTFSARYTITQNDLDRGTVENQAQVIAETSRGDKVSDYSDDPNNVADNDVNNDGNPDDVTTITLTSEVCEVVVYDIVSPDGDGIADYLTIDGLDCYSDNTLEVYNRWGIRVFFTKGYGTTGDVFRGYSDARATIERNEKLPAGTYYYVLNYVNDTGTTVKKAGPIFVITD